MDLHSISGVEKLMIIYSIISLINHSTASSLVDLNCLFGFDDDGKYYCKLSDIEYLEAAGSDSEMEFDFNPHKILQILGDHQDSNSSSDVLILTSTHIEFKDMPMNIHEYFHNLQNLTVKSANLQSIHEIHLKYLTKLTNLDLSNNKIELIERNLFKSNKHLQLIDLSVNNIRYIHETSFDHLTNLQSLNLFSNKCSSLIIDKTSLKFIQEPCSNPIDHLTSELYKNSFESQIKIENLNEKLKNYESLKSIHQVDSQMRSFVSDTNIFMTVLGISIIAIVFYLARSFYQNLNDEAQVDESYEKFKDERNKTTTEEV